MGRVGESNHIHPTLNGESDLKRSLRLGSTASACLGVGAGRTRLLVLTASLLDRGELVHHRRCAACSGAVRLGRERRVLFNYIRSSTELRDLVALR